MTAVAVAGLVGGVLLTAGPALALDQTQFELDKNATDQLQTTRVAVLNSNVSATATTLAVCQLVDQQAATNFVVLIDGELVKIASVTGTGSSTGGCPAGTLNKRTYNVAASGRGFDATFGTSVINTTAAAHSGGADITLMVDTGASTADDWDQVYAQIQADADSKCTSLGAVECAWAHDGFGVSVFTQGGSKDDLNINPLPGESGTGWRWTDSSVPDADEILDAFAIKYASGDQLLFFGADRYATNGAKDFGFWFFHDKVGMEPDGTFSGNHTRPDPGADGVFCGETGNTSNPSCNAADGTRDADDVAGDVLVLGTFTQGGAVTSIRIFEWYGVGGDTNGTLNEVTSFGDCVPGAAADKGCNTVNNTTIPSPWPYSGKGAAAQDVIYSGGMMEGGIDLTALHLQGCFSSFSAETRSSPEPGAQLKDFVLGEFEACNSDLTTTPSDGNGTALTDTDDPANDLPDTQIGTGSAGVDVTDSADLVVNGTPTWSGTLDFYLCGPIASGTCETGGVAVDSQQVNQSTTQPIVSASANLTEVGRYCWRGEFTSDDPHLPGDTDSSTGECFEVKPVQPDLTTTAWSSGGDAGSAQTTAVDFGSPLYDKATLSDTAYQPGTDGAGDSNGDYTSINATMDTPANGTITFTLVGPDGTSTDCTTVASALSGTTGSNPEDVTVSGDDDYFTSGFTPDQPGEYHWKASYDGGDGGNTLGTSHNADCDQGAEDVTVQQIPTQIKTQQSWIPNDTATITSSISGDNLEAGGTVDFALYDNASCSGTAVYTDSATLTGGANSEVVSTTNTGDVQNGGFVITTGYDDAAASTAGPYSWLVTYTPASGDSAHTGIQSSCNAENFSVTYTNDAGPGTDLP